MRHLARKLTRLGSIPDITSRLQDITTQSNLQRSFDPLFYKRAYPESSKDPRKHYLTYGLSSGKPGTAPVLITEKQITLLDSTKQTVLLVVHDSDHSGTPVLTYNIARHLRTQFNVILLPLHGGKLIPAFSMSADVCIEPFPDGYNENVASAVLDDFLARGLIDFAIVNSIVSRSVLRILAEHYIPSVCLIHEFPTYIRPKNASLQVQLWATRTIYSARLVYENTAEQCPELKESNALIIPQGKCSPPENDTHSGSLSDPLATIEDALDLLKSYQLPDGAILIIGVGTVEFRKGVDLFIDCASRLLHACTDLPLLFAWIGPGYDPESDLNYSTFLKDQIHRLGLTDKFVFTGHIQQIGKIYEMADVLFLSSRLDPLPNTAIEAMSSGVPVVCFQNASGIADVLTDFNMDRECVVPYLRTDLAAQKIAALCNKTALRAYVGNTLKKQASSTFDMGKYSGQLADIALNCTQTVNKEKEECLRLINSDLIDLSFLPPPTLGPLTQQQAARLFVRSWRSGVQRRKPFPGFHPGIYAELNDVDLSSSNPLIHFIDAGRPKGRWLSRLISPSKNSCFENPELNSQLKIGLHIHCYYPELLSGLIEQISRQPLKQFDLLVSTTTDDGFRLAKKVTDSWQSGKAICRKVPNKGRDIGPFLTEFGDRIVNDYDIIGHFHTKKSLAVADNGVVQFWVDYLLEHLIGANHHMIPTILDAFARSPKLGLVFPEDPYIVGWSANHPTARQLAEELGIEDIGYKFFNFPVGNMFWARPEALSSLFLRNFQWDDYPEEPLANDGSLLHALERMIPLIVQKHGFRHALTYIPGMTR